MTIDSRRFSTELQFIPITDLPHDQVMKVLDIRNQDGVRHNMYTDHRITEEEHLGWIDRLKSAKDTKFFAVLKDGEVIGGVSISAINTLHRRADWAFYLSESTQGKGVGASLEYQFINLVFSEFDVDKLNCEVISFNEKVVKLHQKFGFTIEGVRRDHVIRDGRKYDAVLLGITKDEWKAQWA